jgi:hypothetical protein
MKDQEFKKLIHSHLSGSYNFFSNGRNLEDGYKPDYVLKHHSKEDYIIIESEHASSRKHIIGGVIKAAKFLTGKKKGIFVIVLQEKENTKKDQIKNQIQTYFTWIKPITNLRYGYVIYDHEYCLDEKLLLVESDEFMKDSVKVE